MPYISNVLTIFQRKQSGPSVQYLNPGTQEHGVDIILRFVIGFLFLPVAIERTWRTFQPSVDNKSKQSCSTVAGATATRCCNLPGIIS